MLPDLGIHPALWEKRHQLVKKVSGKNKYWKRGYEIGKDGGKKSDNPYLKKMDMDLCRKVLFWIMGFEEGAYSRVYRDKRLKKQRKQARKEKKRQERKEQKWLEKQSKKKPKKKKHKLRRYRHLK